MSSTSYLKSLIKLISVMLFVVLFFSSCSDDKKENKTPPNNTSKSVSFNLNGKVQKGSFTDGVIVATKLNGDASLDEKHSVKAKIDDKGEYKLNISWSGLTYFSASGHYFDEYKNINSSQEIELSAIDELSSNSKINLNLFTTLQASRIEELLKLKKDYKEALKITKDELQKVFSLSKDVKAKDLDMFDFSSSIKESNKNLLLLSATFLKITQDKELKASSARGISLKKGGVSSIQRFVSDFSKDGKVDEVFKDEWEEMIADDPVETIKKVESNLKIKLEYVAPVASWSKRLELSVSPAQYIFDGSKLKQIVYDITVPLSNYIDRSKFYKLSYTTKNGTALSGNDYKASSGELSFTYLKNTAKITIDVLSQSDSAKHFSLNFNGITPGLSITNDTLDVEILEKTIKANSNPKLTSLVLNSIKVDGVKSALSQSSDIVFSGSNSSDVELGVSLSSKSQQSTQYFADIYLSADGQTPLFIDKVFVAPLGDVGSRIFYQNVKFSFALDSRVKNFIAYAKSKSKKVKLLAKVDVLDNALIEISSRELPKFAKVSNELNKKVTLSTFTYIQAMDSSCLSPSSDVNFDQSSFYALVDMYGMFHTSYLSSDIGVNYDNVCVKLTYNSHSNEYLISHQNGFGSLDTNIEVDVNGYDVSFEGVKLYKDTIQSVKNLISLPKHHTLHFMNQDGSISPRGERKLAFLAKSYSLNDDLSGVDLEGDVIDNRYLHAKDLPFYLSVSSAKLDSKGLHLKSDNTIYAFAYANIGTNNAQRFSKPLSSTYIFDLDENGIDSDDLINFDATTATSQFPKLTTDIPSFSIKLKNSKIVQTTTTQNEKYKIKYAQHCVSDVCSGGKKYAQLSLNTDTTTLFSDGSSISENPEQKLNISWGEKDSNAVFSRKNDKGVSIYTPGFVLATNSAEKVGEYLYGSVKKATNTLVHYPSSSKDAKSGKYLYSGVNVGSLEASKLQSSTTPNMSVIVGDNQRLDIRNTKDTKYYLRYSGVTGVFNSMDDSLSSKIYGYDLNLDNFSFRQVSNTIDTYSKINGSLHVGGLGDFDVAFKSLALDCAGNLNQAQINTDQENIILDTWKIRSVLTDMEFKNAQSDICSDERELYLGHLLKLMAFKDSIQIGTFWQVDGTPRDTLVNANTDNQLDGNKSKDGELDNDGYDIALKTLDFNYEKNGGDPLGWIESDAILGLPFWGGQDISLRATNKTPFSRDFTVVASKDELYDDVNRTRLNTNEELASDIKKNYSQKIIKDIFNVIDFSLPAYYNNSKDVTPEFTGRVYKKDLYVLKVNANIDKITPKDTKVSFGASASIDPILELDLHIDPNDPKSLKNIDKKLAKIPGVGEKVLENSLGKIFPNFKKFNKYVDDSFSVGLAVPLFISLKSLELLDEKDPYEIAADAMVYIYNTSPIFIQKFKDEIYVKMMNILDEEIASSADRSREMLKRVELYDKLVIYTQKSIDKLRGMKDLTADSRVIYKIRNDFYKYALGSSDVNCSWDNIMNRQSEYKPIGTMLDYADTVKNYDYNSQIDILAGITKGTDFSDHLKSVQESLNDIEFKKLNESREKAKYWVDNEFCSLVRYDMDHFDDFNNTLKKIDDAKDKILGRLVVFNELLVDSETTNLMLKLRTMNEDVNITELRDKLRKLFVDKYAPELDSMLATAKKMNISTADELRALSVYAFLQLKSIKKLDKKMKDYFRPFMQKVRKFVLSIVGVHDSILQKALKKISEKTSKAFEKANASLEKLPIHAADIDGYALLGRDDIKRIHLSAGFKFRSDKNETDEKNTDDSTDDSSTNSGSGGSFGASARVIRRGSGGSFGGGSSSNDDSTSDKQANSSADKKAMDFTANLDIINEAYEGSAGCVGEGAQSNVKASISTESVKIKLLKKELMIDYLELGVALNKIDIPDLGISSPLGVAEPYIHHALVVKGLFGAIISNKGMEFKGFKLFNMGLAIGLGGNEEFIGAKVSAIKSNTQLGINFLVGDVCNQKIIESLMPPKIYEFSKAKKDQFNGYMLYGECQMPIYGSIGGRVQLGTWSLDGPPEVKGALLGAGLFGSFKVYQIIGNMQLLGEGVGADTHYAGDGWIASGYGLGCEPAAWHVVEDSRADDDKCKTIDIEFKMNHSEKEGWKAKFEKPTFHLKG